MCASLGIKTVVRYNLRGHNELHRNVLTSFPPQVLIN
jgi:hypothetical protein